MVYPLLRRTARRAVTRLMGRLPELARRDVMDALVSGPEGYDLFQAIGRRYGVKDISVVGDYGLIEGSLADDKIIAGYAKSKNWAMETNKFFTDFFKTQSAGTYIDVGANLGLTTIPIAALPRVDCKALEPDPDNYRHLVHNVAEHCRNKNVELFDIAAWDTTGTLDFELDAHNHGDHRIHVATSEGKLLEAERQVINVFASRLDDLFDPATLKHPIALKMDTQGSESQIFAGGERLLSQCALVFFEYWPYSMTRFGADIDRLTTFITQHFSEGAMVLGDANMAPYWWPIEEVVKTMYQHWQLADKEPFNYFEIYLRK
jgi:FkbM family methyltransferase